MILHESVPCRLSRWALLPIAALTLGAFCSPVLAQDREGGDTPRIEIRVNGKDLRDLTPRERQRLMKELGEAGVHLRGLLGELPPADTAVEPRRVLAAIHDPESIRRVLGAMGRSAAVTVLASARSAPAQREMEWE